MRRKNKAKIVSKARFRRFFYPIKRKGNRKMLIAFGLWRLPDSNRPPSDCEPDALPDELNPRLWLQKYNIFRNQSKLLEINVNLPLIIKRYHDEH